MFVARHDEAGMRGRPAGDCDASATNMSCVQLGQTAPMQHSRAGNAQQQTATERGREPQRLLRPQAGAMSDAHGIGGAWVPTAATPSEARGSVSPSFPLALAAATDAKRC
jgi:hypothetical protein